MRDTGLLALWHQGANRVQGAGGSEGKFMLASQFITSLNGKIELPCENIYFFESSPNGVVAKRESRAVIQGSVLCRQD